jgi:hypothetical protein
MANSLFTSRFMADPSQKTQQPTKEHLTASTNDSPTQKHHPYTTYFDDV